MGDKTYALTAVDAEPIEHAPDGWRVTCLGDLAWAMEQAADALAEKAENEALANEAIARIQAWLTSRNAQADSRLAYFESQIRIYAENNKGELLHGKKKSRDLPAGSVGWRKKGGGLVVEDEAATLAWCEAVDALSLVRVKKEIDKTALKARCKDSGEVPDGCSIAPETEELYVKPVVPEVCLSATTTPLLQEKK